ncbi:MAG: deoxyribodipyrimidine photo-lyase, partial [Acidobacteriota bacterium]|nr:deoxyribodipyrimidine photo-lyase [Acidobacteriota bacterium]
MSAAPTIFWFRRDLRRADHPALAAAARAGSGRVLGAFVVDDVFAAPAGPTRAAFLTSSLRALDDDIAGSLVVRTGDPAPVLAGLAAECGAREVFATADFAPAGRRRDERVARSLAEGGVALRLIDSPYVVAPGSLTTRGGAPWRVFGAYRGRWEPLAVPATTPAPDVEWVGAASEGPAALMARAARRRPWYFGTLPDDPPSALLPAGEAPARALLAAHARRVDAYDLERNVPALD